MNQDARFQRSSDAVAVEPEPGHSVVLQLESGEYHALNEAATALWQQLEQPVGVPALAETLVQRFGADPSQAYADAISLVEGLQARGLIVEI